MDDLYISNQIFDFDWKDKEIIRKNNYLLLNDFEKEYCYCIDKNIRFYLNFNEVMNRYREHNTYAVSDQYCYQNIRYYRKYIIREKNNRRFM